jgi:hypothetical protein
LLGIDPAPKPLVNAREEVKAAEEKRDKYRAERRPEIENRIREVARLAEQARRFGDRRTDLEALVSKQLASRVAVGPLAS